MTVWHDMCSIYGMIDDVKKARYYPNFIQKRDGNIVYFLTEVIGGDIIRRNVDLVGGVNIHTERNKFLAQARLNANDVLSNQIAALDKEYDGEPYSLSVLPSGIGFLDVLGEMRHVIWSKDGAVTMKEAECAIFRAVERKRAKKK